jgi:hypothetical protein
VSNVWNIDLDDEHSKKEKKANERERERDW